MLEIKMSDVTIIPNEMKMRGILDANEESVVIEGSFVGEINAKKVSAAEIGKLNKSESSANTSERLIVHSNGFLNILSYLSIIKLIFLYCSDLISLLNLN